MYNGFSIHHFMFPQTKSYGVQNGKMKVNVALSLVTGFS